MEKEPNESNQPNDESDINRLLDKIKEGIQSGESGMISFGPVAEDPPQIDKSPKVTLIRVARKQRMGGTPMRLLLSKGYDIESMSNPLNPNPAPVEFYDLQFQIDNPQRSIYDIMSDLQMRDTIIIEEISEASQGRSFNPFSQNMKTQEVEENASIMIWVSCLESDLQNTIQIIRLVSLKDHEDEKPS